MPIIRNSLYYGMITNMICEQDKGYLFSDRICSYFKRVYGCNITSFDDKSVNKVYFYKDDVIVFTWETNGINEYSYKNLYEWIVTFERQLKLEIIIVKGVLYVY